MVERHRFKSAERAAFESKIKGVLGIDEDLCAITDVRLHFEGEGPASDQKPEERKVRQVVCDLPGTGRRIVRELSVMH